MIYIAIIEDQPLDLNRIQEYIQEYGQKHEQNYEICSYADSASFLAEGRKVNHFDLLFLDIELPGLNGMELAVRLRKEGFAGSIVFTTNMAQFAIQGYEVSAIDFLVKPIVREIFMARMVRYMKRIGRRKQTFQIRTRSGLRLCRISDLYFFEVREHRIRACGLDLDEEFSGTLKSIEAELGDEGFVKCNQCYLVNLRHVDRIEGDEVDVGGIRLQISRREKRNFMNAFASYEGDRV